MATTWGSYRDIGGTLAQVGLDLSYSPSSVSGSTTSVTVSWALLLRTQGWANGNDDWSVSGGASGSGRRSWSHSGAATSTIASGTKTVALVYGSTQKFSMSGRMDDLAGSTTDLTVSASLTIPARPVTAPAAPSGATITRASDAKQVLTWVNNGTPSAPVDSSRIERRDNTMPAGQYVTVAIVGGAASSFVDATTRADRRYNHRIRSGNSAGGSDWTYFGVWSTTPAAPGAPTVKKNASGGIVVTRGSLSDAATGWRVYDSPDGGADVLVSGSEPIAAGTTSWTHASPDPAQTHRYRLEAVTTQPVLYSAKGGYSSTVQLQAPPAAPTNLAPAVADATEAITLTARHNPVDTSEQTYYEVEQRATSADPWTTLAAKTASGVTAHEVPADTWANGAPVRLRWRTWGADPDPSPWSAEHVLTLSARPVAGITSPAASWSSQRLTAAWTYFDEESSAQSAWEAVLADSSGTPLETRSATGAATSAAFVQQVANGASYEVRVRVRDGANLWSHWAVQAFTVAYAPPPTPTLEAAWHEDDGYVTLTADVGAEVPPERPAVSLRLERATPAGWVMVQGADDLESWPTTVTDMTPPLGQAIQYRVVAVSDIGSEAYSETVAVDARACWVFINHGPGFGQVVRLDSNIDVGRTFGRAKVLHQFVGRRKPVEFGGGHTTRTYSVSATLWNPVLTGGHGEDQSSWEDIEALAEAEAPVIVRDPSGVRLFCSVGDVDESGLHGTTSRVTIPLTEVDWSES